ncbi:peptidoglycan/LPS O-acetylase OafA/YrhL/lysophospholipase L1-like esterase [Crossiella equi]|uniref:Peptidoglycan/LPS O-acetylase OafA/YrhL/lysophospholipase L1-like esterase n=1 Tax=Crossiella equi TaxID=130796 RepID=A0ABS5APA5_9PSEU|nr:acyltransferase family protein [Crossiella equi]MBP2478391.1 peptidoglycan/LPS O-acetylase OafA/YrhL/lysophospholipase L1-like esterase [Crossiella equi]
MTTLTATRQHVAALDGLRGLAVAGVLLFHAGHLTGGFLGVDLFFALSGYLITDLLLREARTTGTVALTAFWGRRVRRLGPALVLLLVAVTLLTWAFDANLLRTALSDGPWAQFNLVNWHLLGEHAAYWDRFGPGRVFGHLWSIAVEEQFYLLWPLVVLGLARFSRRLDRDVTVAAVLVSAVSVTLMVLLAGPDTSRVYTGTDTRAFSLMLGALAATEPVRRLVGGRVPWWLPGLPLVVFWLVASDAPWLYPGGLFLHSLLSALLVLACAQRPVPVLAWPPLRWLGGISYGLYLWHWPVYLLLSPERTGLSGWPWTVLVVAVSVLAAVLSKHLVEDPLRYRVYRAGPALTAVVMASVLAFWFVVPRPATATVDTGGLGRGVESANGPRLAKVLYMGDSIAAGLSLPVAEALKASGVAMTSIAADGGGGVVGPLAETTWADLPSTLARERPTAVVYQVTTYDWGSEAEQRAGYQRLVEVARGHGARVVFVGMPPIRADEFYAARLPELNRANQVVASLPEAIFLDSAPLWGPDYQGRAPDGIHACPQGAARFTGWLLTGLAAHFSGLRPVAPEAWANTGWAADKRFQGC